MAYTWLGMRKMDWEEVKEIHNGTGLAGYYKLYPDQNSESVIEPGYEWEDIEHHYLCGGEFGEELDRTELTLPDGKKIEAPVVVDISELGALDELEYGMWCMIEEYLLLFGIGMEDDEPDWATVKAVQDRLIEVLKEAGVAFKVGGGEGKVNSEEILTGQKNYEQAESESKVDRIQVNLQIVVTQEDIDDIMVSALEGGITYWCDKAEVDGNYLGEYASDQISRGGTLILHDGEEGRTELLTKEKLLQGIRMYAENPMHRDIFEMIDHELHIDCGNVDAEAADAIIQYAIFSEIFYG